jgi:NAD(P)-dependent dehydrogenase (short-subunit alcohol dehydrogenase family)
MIKSNIPLGRIGKKNDIAGVCIFLSSEAGSYVNGGIPPSMSCVDSSYNCLRRRLRIEQ